MPSTRLSASLTFALLLGWAHSAQAHFLWLDAGKPGTSAVSVYFSEAAESGDPELLDRIGHVKVWAHTLDGGFRILPLRRSDDSLTADGLAGLPTLIGLAHTYGVTSRANETFLLKYYAKTYHSSDPAAWEKFRPSDQLALEIMPQLDGKKLALTVLWKGEGLSASEVVVSGPGLSTLKDQTDGQGQVVFALAASGLYSIRARHVENVKGTYEGKAYASVRHYSTLSLSVGAAAQANTGKADDAEAGARMAAAHKARADWGAKFAGFTAKLEVNLDGKVHEGTVTVARNGDTKVELSDPEAAKWAQANLHSTVMHRNPGEDRDYSEDAYSQYRFAESDESHPLGRLIADGESSGRSTYRVRDCQILEVHRESENTHFTISVLENVKNMEGCYLPRIYTVSFWNAQTGKVERTSTTHDEWIRVADFDLPRSTLVVTTSDGKRLVRHLILSDHRIATASGASGKP